MQNIAADRHVAVAIYDTTVPFGTGAGVQLGGEAAVVPWDDEMAVRKALSGIAQRFPLEPEEECIAKHLGMFQAMGYVICEVSSGQIHMNKWSQEKGDHRVNVSVPERKLGAFVMPEMPKEPVAQPSHADDDSMKAHGIITEAMYLTLGTSDAKGTPWVSPVAFWAGDGPEFYFVSMPASRHMQNISVNSRVAVSIFNSTAPFMTGAGVQFYGEATVVPWKDEAGVRQALSGIAQRFPAESPEQCIAKHVGMFQGMGYVVCKIVPGQLHMNKWTPEKADHRVTVAPPMFGRFTPFVAPSNV